MTVPDWQRPAPYPVRPEPADQNRITVWTILTPLIFIAVHFLIQLLVFVGYMVANYRQISFGVGDPGLPISDFLYQNQAVPMSISSALSACIYAGFLYVRRRRGERWLLTRRPRLLDWVSGLSMIMGTLGTAMLTLWVIDILGNYVPFWAEQLENYTELTTTYADQSPLYIQIIAIVFLVPLAEELLFRGIICGQLRKALPDWAVIIVSALIFAVVHWSWVQSAYVILAGLALGAAYIWSESIWLTLGMHAAFNFIGSILPTLIEPYPAAGTILVIVEVLFVVVGLFFCWLLYMRRRGSPTGRDGMVSPATQF